MIPTCASEPDTPGDVSPESVWHGPAPTGVVSGVGLAIDANCAVLLSYTNYVRGRRREAILTNVVES